jgi:hypothetical protein
MRRVYALAFARDLCNAWPHATNEAIAEEAVTRAVALEKALEQQEKDELRITKNLARSSREAA